MVADVVQQSREPSTYLILAGLVGSAALVVVAVATQNLYPHQRYGVAQLIFLALSAFLMFQIARHAGVRKAPIGESGFWLGAAILGIVMVPCTIKVVSDIYALRNEPVPPNTQLLFQLSLIIALPLAMALAAVGDRDDRRTTAQFLVIPTSLVSLILFLGSPEGFGYLVGTIDPSYLEANFIIRTIVGASFAMAFFVDAALSFARLKRSVSLALSKERENLRNERQSLVLRKSTAIGRFAQFAILDVSRVWVLGSTVFTTGLYVLARAAMRSLEGIWKGLSSVGIGVALLIFLSLAVQDRADYVLTLVGRSLWDANAGLERLAVWAAYFFWLGGTVALFFRLARIRADDVNFAATTVFFFLLSGAWLLAFLLTIAANTFVPTLSGYRGITPFLALGFALVVFAILRSRGTALVQSAKATFRRP